MEASSEDAIFSPVPCAEGGWNNESIRGIIVTHGHLDHILNVASLAKDSGAWIAAPRLDALHYEGRFAYRGAARVCGWLEAAGRRVFSYRAFPARSLAGRSHRDSRLARPHGDPFAGSYRRTHWPLLPRSENALLRGSLCELRNHFSSPARHLQQPPGLVHSSIARALTLDLDGVIPNHCDSAPFSEHLRRLRLLKERLER